MRALSRPGTSGNPVFPLAPCYLLPISEKMYFILYVSLVPRGTILYLMAAEVVTEFSDRQVI